MLIRLLFIVVEHSLLATWLGRRSGADVLGWWSSLCSQLRSLLQKSPRRSMVVLQVIELVAFSCAFYWCYQLVSRRTDPELAVFFIVLLMEHFDSC